MCKFSNRTIMVTVSLSRLNVVIAAAAAAVHDDDSIIILMSKSRQRQY